MAKNLIRADYEVLKRALKSFQRQSQAINATHKRIRRSLQELEGGAWVGRGADKFYAEMHSDVSPSLDRLSSALDQAGSTTRSIIAQIQQAEEMLKQIFRSDGTGAGPSSGTAEPAKGGGGGSGATGEADKGGAKLASKLGKKTQELVSKSPHLSKQLDELAKDGWKVKPGTAGGGSYTDRKNKVIVVDSDQSAEENVRTLAHEVGHAEYGKPPYHKPTAEMSRQDYIDLNVQEKLRSEGAAQLNGATVRSELNDADGPDIGISGSQTKKYQAVYDDYAAGDITRDQAIDKMATLMGNETTSTTGENYKDYYGNTYENHWDNNIAPARKKK